MKYILSPRETGSQLTLCSQHGSFYCRENLQLGTNGRDTLTDLKKVLIKTRVESNEATN